MKEVWFNMSGNNKMLRKAFPNSIITKKKVELGMPDSTFLIQAIKGSDLRFDHQGFNLLDIELEGEYNDWTLSLKLGLI